MSKKPDTTEATTPTLVNATPAQLQSALFEARKRKLESIKAFFESHADDFKALGIAVCLNVTAKTSLDEKGREQVQEYEFTTFEVPEFVKKIKKEGLSGILSGFLSSLKDEPQK